MGLSITGIGILWEYGNTLDELYRAMCGSREKRMISISKTKELRFADNITRKAYTAMKRAAEDSGLNCMDRNDMGIFIGSAFSSLASTVAFEKTSLEKGIKAVMPMDFVNTVMNAPAGQLAILFGVTGMNVTVSDGSAASIGAVRMCVDMIKSGRMNTAAVGGIEELSEVYHQYMNSNGTEPSEGFCIFIAEDTEEAKKRGAHIYAEVIGSAYQYKNDPSADDILSVMASAAADAGIGLDDVDFVVTSCAGETERKAVEKTKLRSVDIKTAVGDTYGASGAFSIAAAAAIYEKGILPNGAAVSEKGTAMINSFGFDGFMGCVMLRQGGN